MKNFLTLAFQFYMPGFDCLKACLHLANKIPVQKSRFMKKNKAEHKLYKDTKRIMQDFSSSLGLLVDITKAGFGNINDGNFSHKFLKILV